MAKKKKKGELFQNVQQAVPKTRQEAQKIVKQAESGSFGSSVASAAKSKAETTREKNAAALRSEIKRTSNLLKVNNNVLKKSEAPSLSSNRAEILSRNISQGLYRGRSMTGMPQLQDSAVAQRTRNNEQYAKLVDAGLWKNGIYGTTLRPVNDEEMGYRQKYGYGKQYAEHINELSAPGKEFEYTKQVRDRNGRLVGTEQDKSTGLEKGRAFMGVEEAFMPRSYEKVLEKQYGYTDPSKSGLNVKQLEEARGSKSYMAGNLAGQTAQFAMAAPFAAPLEAAALTRAGIGAARAGKALRGVNTVRDAFKVAAIRNGVQSAVAVPINLMDALKEDNTADILKRFALNEAFDIGLGGLFEVPMLRRNVHFVKAVDLNNAANAARNTAEAIGLRRQAIDELKKLDEQTIDAVRAMLDNRGTRNALERSINQYSGGLSLRPAERIANWAGHSTGDQQDFFGVIDRQLARNQASEAAEEVPERAVREAVEEVPERTARETAEEVAPPVEQRNLSELIEEPRVEPEVRAEEPRVEEPRAEAPQAEPRAEEPQGENLWNELDEEGMTVEPRPREVRPEDEEVRAAVSETWGNPDIPPARAEEWDNQAAELYERGKRLDELDRDLGRQYGRYDKGNVPKGDANGGVVSRGADRYAASGIASDEADLLGAENTLLYGLRSKQGKSVAEAQADALAAWEKNETFEMGRLIHGAESMRKKWQTPEGYTDLQEFFASLEQGTSRIQNRQQAARDAYAAGEITYDEARNIIDACVEKEAMMADAGVQVASMMGTGMRQYQAWLNISPAARESLVREQINWIEEHYAKQFARVEEKFNLPKGSRHIVVDPELIKELRSIPAGDKEAVAQCMKKISENVWDQVPASRKEMLDAWRMTAMLLNPRTHLRNIVGNAIFRPAILMKDAIATPMEKFAIKHNWMDAADATKAILTNSEADNARKELGDWVFSKNPETIRGASKYFDSANKGLLKRQTGGKIYSAGKQGLGSKPGQMLRAGADRPQMGNARLLDSEDIGEIPIKIGGKEYKIPLVGLKSKFSDSYAKALKARDIDAKELRSVLEKNAKHVELDADEKALLRQHEEIIDLSKEEAQRAVYRDDSVLANFLNRLRSVEPDDPWYRQAVAYAIDTRFPFVKTPINIVRRSIDYSPGALLYQGYKLNRAVAAHDSKAAREAIDRMAAGTTGTGAWALGIWLGSKDGWGLNAKLADGDEGRYQKDLGYQNYALNLGGDDGWSFTLDWAVPASIPIFMGVETANAAKDGRIDLTKVIDLLGESIDPVFELSVLSGLDDALKTLQGNEGRGAALIDFGVSTALNYAGQFNPTLSGQIARTIDPVRRNTSLTTGDNTVENSLQRWGNKQLAKTPGLSFLLEPYVNSTTGEEEVSPFESYAGRALYNTLSPGYISKKKVDDVSNEVERLNKVFPDDQFFTENIYKPEMSFNDKVVELSPSEITAFNKTRGRQYHQQAKQLIKTSEYQNASNKEKMKMMKAVYSGAKVDAKHDALIMHGEDPWEVYTDDLKGKRKPEYEDAKAAGFTPEEYYDYATSKAWDADGNGRPNNQELCDWLNTLDLTSEQKAVLFDKYKPNKKTKNPYANGATTVHWYGRGGSSSKRSGRRRSGGGRRRSGGSSKAKRTASSKSYSATHTASDLRSNIKPVSIPASSLKGLSKSQRKALLKMINKRLEA